MINERTTCGTEEGGRHEHCQGSAKLPGRHQPRMPLFPQQRPQHVLHDAAVAVVVGLTWSVDTHHRVEADVASGHIDRLRGTALSELCDPREVESLLSGEPERLGGLTLWELQRQHTHPDEVGAVNPLVRLGYHRFHPEESRAFC